MFVYIWKHPNGVPFYVGATKDKRRTDPTTSSPRSNFCKAFLREVGPENVIVELHDVASMREAQVLETQLIEEYGRITQGNGTLVNLRKGGEGVHPMPLAQRQSASERMKLNNPMHNPEIRAKAAKRMRDPRVKAKFSGDNNPAKRPEVRQKIRDAWNTPEYRDARIAEKQGRPIHSDESKEKRRQRLLDPSNPMRNTHIMLNSDMAIREKRNAAIRSPESRAKKSEAMKRVWEERRRQKE